MSLYARLNRRFGQRPSGRERQERIASRVDALRAHLPVDAFAAPGERASNGSRVAVVGGGFAGLSSAYFLASYGYEVEVFEARTRVGGRVCTLPNFTAGGLIEAGAELIGLNHPFWLGFASTFGLSFAVVTPEDDFAGVGLEMPLYLDGRMLTPAEAERVWEEMDRAFDTLDEPSRAVDPYEPWTAPDAQRLDLMPLSQWKDSLPLTQLGAAAVEAEIANNNVEPSARQSYLANLALVAGGGGKSFWTETEVFRCGTGNESLAWALERAVGSMGSRNAVHKDAPVQSIRISDRDVTVMTATGATTTADYVVLAIPPTAWPTLRVDPPIPPHYVMNVGPAVKFLSVVDERFWIDSGRAPSGTDETVGETWEGTDNQTLAPGQNPELTVFAGADAARRALDHGDPVEWYARSLDVMFPGYSSRVVDHEFVAWPREQWTGGGYSCPLPGQVTTVAPRLARPFCDRLLFAGEHTCPAFFGYMEGALQSGLLATTWIWEADGHVARADVLAALRAAIAAAR